MDGIKIARLPICPQYEKRLAMIAHLKFEIPCYQGK
jgi:hypothetical protein